MQILGDGMAPQFPQGTIAIVYPSSEAKSGNLVIAQKGDFRQQHGDDHPIRFRFEGPDQITFRLGKTVRVVEGLAEAEKEEFVVGPLLEQAKVQAAKLPTPILEIIVR